MDSECGGHALREQTASSAVGHRVADSTDGSDKGGLGGRGLHKRGGGEGGGGAGPGEAVADHSLRRRGRSGSRRSGAARAGELFLATNVDERTLYDIPMVDAESPLSQ